MGQDLDFIGCFLKDFWADVAVRPTAEVVLGALVVLDAFEARAEVHGEPMDALGEIRRALDQIIV